MPELYGYYAKTLKKLHDHNTKLKQVFQGSVFSGTTYNLGPRTVCFEHKDFANLAFGMCAITALGEFNHERGGHLVLWECGLVIEFPAGATVLIPSAIITHSNVVVGDDEHRYSVTQYTAGGIFRWVENGFKTNDVLSNYLSGEELVEKGKKDAERWDWGISLRRLIPLKKDEE